MTAKKHLEGRSSVPAVGRGRPAFARLSAAAIPWLLAAAWSVPAEAASVLRSAEFPGYSRIVVPVASGQTWEVKTAARAASVVLPGAVPDFDTGAVFARMARTRVLSVNARPIDGGAAIDLALACDCRVDVSRISPTQIALDVRRATSGPAAQGDGSAIGQGEYATLEPPVAAAPTGHGGAPMPGQSAGQPLGGSGLTGRLPRRPPGQVADLQGEVGSAQATTPKGPGDAGGAQLAELRGSLLAGLDRAARAGLVEPAEGASVAPEGANGQPAGADGGLVLPSENGTSTGQIRVQTADVPSQKPSVPLRPSSTCPDPASLDAAAWYESGPMPKRLAELRRSLVTPAGDVDPEVALVLARYYLGQGFGAEAREVITAAGLPGRQAAVIEDIARIIDGLAPATDGPLATAGGCGGAADLWRALSAAASADPSDAVAAPVSTEVMDALKALPQPLRKLLGPRLALSMLESTPAIDTRPLQTLLDRTPGPTTPEGTLAEAELLLVEGRPDQALPRLAAVAQAPSSAAPSALARQAAVILDSQDETTVDLRQDLEIAARENRGAPVELSLTLNLARAEARSGHIGKAFAALESAFSSAPEDQRGAVAAVASDLLAEVDPALTPPAEIGRAILDHEDLIRAGDGRGLARSAAAQRLAEIGLPSAALNILDEAQHLSDGAATLREAELMLAASEFDRALTRLETMPGLEAVRIRVRALKGKGLLDAAYREAGALPPDDPLRSEIAGLTGRWAEAGNASEYLASLRDLARPEASPTTNAEMVGAAMTGLPGLEPLQEARALLDHAQSLRAAAEAAIAGASQTAIKPDQ